MNTRSLLPFALLAMLVVGTANAATVTTSSGAGTYAVGETFTVTSDITINCLAQQSNEGTFVATIVDGPDWIDASEEDFSYGSQDCLSGGGDVTKEVSITVTVTDAALAFEDYSIQPGLVDEENDGGAINISQAYTPNFTVPTSIGFDVGEGGSVETSIPVTVAQNAESILTFTVASFQVDGAAAPDAASLMVEFDDNVSSPLADGADSASVDVPVNFAISGHDHDDAMAEDGDGETEGHFHWETATATISAVMSPVNDESQVSETQTIIMTFTNTDHDSMPHGDDDQDDAMEGEDDTSFIPGYQAIAAIAVLGAIVVLRRRA